MRIPPILLWTIFGLGLILAAGIWFVLVRPVTPGVAFGMIVSKTFQAAEAYTRVRSGPRREFWSEEKFRIPASYVFAIRLDDTSEVHYRLEATAAAEFKIGQKVQVRLEERGIPLLWKRMYVRQIAAVNH